MEPGIPADVFDRLETYFKFASSAYTPVCPRPCGKILVAHFTSPATDAVHGFVARDSEKRELVVAIRGSGSVTDILLDTQIILVPFLSPGVSAPDGTLVHSGFLAAWNSIAVQVSALIAEQFLLHRGYNLVVTGHSLGGAIAILGAMFLQKKFPGRRVSCYNYGAPRVGNEAFSDFVRSELGFEAYRVVHTDDGVPTMIPTSLGYHHHGVEYWLKRDPTSLENTCKCSPTDGEDPECSASIPSKGLNAAHMTYFGILATTPFCL